MDRFGLGMTVEKPLLGPILSKVVSESVKKSRRQHDEAFFVTFPGSDANSHASTIDVRWSELNRLLQPQAPRIKSHENHSMLQVGLRFQQRGNRSEERRVGTEC